MKLIFKNCFPQRQNKTLAEQLENVLQELEDSPRDKNSLCEQSHDQDIKVEMNCPTTPTRTPIKNLPFSPSQVRTFFH